METSSFIYLIYSTGLNWIDLCLLSILWHVFIRISIDNEYKMDLILPFYYEFHWTLWDHIDLWLTILVFSLRIAIIIAGLIDQSTSSEYVNYIESFLHLPLSDIWIDGCLFKWGWSLVVLILILILIVLHDLRCLTSRILD